MFYELIGGNHNEKGKDYTKGDQFESDHDLCELFPNKFKPLHGMVGDQKPPTIPSPSRVQAKPAKEKETQHKALEASEKDIAEVPATSDGVDVTTEFPNAVELDLRVIKISPRRYNVIDPGENGEVQNDAPLPKEKVEELLLTFLGV